MPRDAPKKPKKDSTPPPEESGKRNTLVPAFDVETFARAVDGTQSRKPVVTVTNEVELEEARRASMKSSMPPPLRPRVRSEADVEIGTAEVEVDDIGDDEDSLLATLGAIDRVPKLLVGAGQVPQLGLDHHAGFMLALVDGVLNYETILDVCGMPRVQALEVLATLVRRGVIGPKKK